MRGLLGQQVNDQVSGEKGAVSIDNQQPRARVSKGLFLGSVGIGLGIDAVLVIVANVQIRSGARQAGLALIALSWIPMLYAAIFMLILWHKSWAAIQDGHARTTPGKAVGFLFIPFFNIYWIFQAVWGLSKDFNAYLRRHSIFAARLPEGLFLAFCILCLTTWIPIVGLVLRVVNCILGLMVVSALCDGINALPGQAPGRVEEAPREAGKEGPCKVEFDGNGKVMSIALAQGQWARYSVMKRKGQSNYYTQKAGTLLQAAEILKKLSSIPQLTYYVVDTPDGSLGRDVNGYYTEARLKTEHLAVPSRCAKAEAVESLSLKGFGDEMANLSTAALLKKQGQYSRLVLLMKCGHCGYESPVETQAGAFVRECYCCGVKNKAHRGSINVFIGSRSVEI